MTGAVVGRTALEGLRVPDALSARVPAEQRGAGRDDVRLLVSRGTEVSHHAFRDLAGQLRAGDVLVVNTSRTLPAAVGGGGSGVSGWSSTSPRAGTTAGGRWSCGRRARGQGRAPGGARGRHRRAPVARPGRSYDCRAAGTS